MSDGRFFSTTRKGEIHEFKEDLRALDRGKRKDAVKKVIAAMTVGKDVSMLFPDVVNCMQTEDLELKKLVYLYLINYAKTQPDLAIMAVNTFVKDTQDPNPLIRALAVRTMGCIRVDKITEYLCDPLQRCLKDDDPYVRKTAVVCVAKLYDIAPELVEDRGFLETLQSLLGDSNPMVVANAVAALAEIAEASGKDVLQVTRESIKKLLRALNECTEWGQVFILDALSAYTPKDGKEAEETIERVTPRLQHANCAVVLSAVKVIFKQLEVVDDDALHRTLFKKMAPPLVTLLSAEPEIQYVALRNINLIVQKYPTILAHEVKVFFCKYNDPIYVKMEKLEIMIMLASDKSIDQVLLEFKEYATEVDVDFVRKAVRAIGRCAVSLERAAERCINVLLELIQTKVNYVVQEAIIVIKDIFRRYPNRYESIIATLCENLDTLDEPEAKASMIWIIGEYAERIDNADELLEQFLETFPEEQSMVQLQLVTATVKLFLKKPTEKPQAMIQLVLTYATQETDNPDLRDRAYVYWRLLSTDPEAAKDVVLAEKPVIADNSAALEPSLLQQLLADLSTLASVYHKPPETFVSRTRLAVVKAEDLQVERAEEEDGGGGDESTGAPSTSGEEAAPGTPKPPTPRAAPPPPPPDLLGDLLDLGVDDDIPGVAAGSVPASNGGVLDLLGELNGLSVTDPHAPAAAQTSDGIADLFGSEAPARAAQALPTVLPADKGRGLTLMASLAREGGAPVYKMAAHNGTEAPVDGFMIQFNKNAFGLAPGATAVPLGTIAPGGSAEASVPVALSAGQVAPGAAPNVLQVAIKTAQLGVFYYTDAVPLEALFLEGGRIEAGVFVSSWKSIPDANEATKQLPLGIGGVEELQVKLQAANVFLMAQKPVPGSNEQALYLTAAVPTNPGPTQLLLEIRYSPGLPGLKVFTKSSRPDLAPQLFDAVARLLA